MCCTGQGSQFRTVPVGTAGIYHTGPCIGTDTTLVSYWKKYRPYQPHTYFQKLATSVLDQIETSLILPHEKNHDLPKTINPIVQISGNFASVSMILKWWVKYHSAYAVYTWETVLILSTHPQDQVVTTCLMEMVWYTL